MNPENNELPLSTRQYVYELRLASSCVSTMRYLSIIERLNNILEELRLYTSSSTEELDRNGNNLFGETQREDNVPPEQASTPHQSTLEPPPAQPNFSTNYFSFSDLEMYGPTSELIVIDGFCYYITVPPITE
ncbi:hypothetical protein TTRE_0000874401 [Trichuris trichiura]|uniref:Uncharacterized protein n=1 Tax=Trichuris trichiura TaxID=36087 RepID=A0A077ZJ03_TRITR|nr:hypothetical protein TTRE_0000874401 [Trichuris trichiura]